MVRSTATAATNTAARLPACITTYTGTNMTAGRLVDEPEHVLLARVNGSGGPSAVTTARAHRRRRARPAPPIRPRHRSASTSASAVACTSAVRTSSSSSGCSLHAVRVAPLSAHGVQPIDRGLQSIRSDRTRGMRHGPFGADRRCQGRRQLGDVVREQQVGSGALTEAEVDHPGVAVVGEEDVRQPQVAMRDPMLRGASRPGPRSRRATDVGELVALEPVERTTCDRLVREDERVRLARRHRDESRRADADCRGP